MLSDLTGLFLGKSFMVSRVRGYFPGYCSFHGENVSPGRKIYRQNRYIFDRSGYLGIKCDLQ